jgi:hypothetical protein
MKRFGVPLIALLIVALSAAVYAAVPPDKAVINSIQKLKPGVPFDHRAHVMRAADCKECHHKMGEERKCSACHFGAKLKDVYHRQCKNCHKKQGKGPTRCEGCHKK